MVQIINYTALAIPLPAVIISLSVEDYKYKINRFPPTNCISNGPMWFYSVIVIIDVLVGIETYLLFVVFWIIHKVNIFLNYKCYHCYRNLSSNQSIPRIKGS